MHWLCFSPSSSTRRLWRWWCWMECCWRWRWVQWRPGLWFSYWWQARSRRRRLVRRERREQRRNALFHLGDGRVWHDPNGIFQWVHDLQRGGGGQHAGLRCREVRGPERVCQRCHGVFDEWDPRELLSYHLWAGFWSGLVCCNCKC